MRLEGKCQFCESPCGNSWCQYSNGDLMLELFKLEKPSSCIVLKFVPKNNNDKVLENFKILIKEGLDKTKKIVIKNSSFFEEKDISFFKKLGFILSEDKAQLTYNFI